MDKKKRNEMPDADGRQHIDEKSYYFKLTNIFPIKRFY